MKKGQILLISVTMIVMPIIAILIVLLTLKYNIFDNPDFWYGYMAYFGTIILAAVALWQNHQLGEINKKSQKNIETISIRSNEINIISKIIEHEETRLQQLNVAFDKFIDFCDPGFILSKTLYKSGRELHDIVDEFGRENELLYNNVFNGLSWGTQDDRKLKYLVVELNMKLFDMLGEVREKGYSDLGTEVLDKKLQVMDYYRDYFKKYQTHLETILFKDLSLDEVRKLYERTEEETSNEET